MSLADQLKNYHWRYSPSSRTKHKWDFNKKKEQRWRRGEEKNKGGGEKLQKFLVHVCLAAVPPHPSFSLKSTKSNTEALQTSGLTFQRQRLPDPKLLEHDNKQSDHNSDGNHFHAIQSHGHIVLDAACGEASWSKLKSDTESNQLVPSQTSSLATLCRRADASL